MTHAWPLTLLKKHSVHVNVLTKHVFLPLRCVVRARRYKLIESRAENDLFYNNMILNYSSTYARKQLNIFRNPKNSEWREFILQWVWFDIWMIGRDHQKTSRINVLNCNLIFFFVKRVTLWVKKSAENFFVDTNWWIWKYFFVRCRSLH